MLDLGELWDGTVASSLSVSMRRQIAARGSLGYIDLELIHRTAGADRPNLALPTQDLGVRTAKCRDPGASPVQDRRARLVDGLVRRNSDGRIYQSCH